MSYSGEQRRVWMIERVDTGEALGTRDRLGAAGLDFGARVPLMWGGLRDCRAAWLRHCVDVGFLVRTISLPGRPAVYKPGPDYGMMPLVSFVRVDLKRGDFEIPTAEELGIDA